jgi:hyperosmotically inducible protein
MKKQIAYMLITASMVTVPLVFTTGCAVAGHRESAHSYIDDKTIQTKIKTALYSDPVVKGTEVDVSSLNGVVQLSGFVDSQAAKNRAGQIAASTPGVVDVHNNLLLPTGR